MEVSFEQGGAPVGRPQIGAEAQTPDTDIYLKSDKLFEHIAARTLKHTKETDLERFGRNLENNLASEKHRERKAADMLVAFQSNPSAVFFQGQSGTGNVPPEQKALRADTLFAEYVDALIDQSPGKGKDPLKELAQKLKSSDGRRKLNEDLEKRLGTGPERERNAANLLLDIGKNLSPSQQQELRSKLNRPEKSMEVPYPLCVAWPPCPQN
jgi:hypothetical protein